MTSIKLAYVHEFCDRHGTVRRYFRRPGFKQMPLPGLPGSAEFMAAYQTALECQPLAIGAKRTKPGSVNAALAGYYTSLEFRSLAAATQAMRRAILRFRRDHGDKSIATLPPKFIAATLGKMQPHAARNWLKAIRHLAQFCVAQEMLAADPTHGLKLPRIKSDGHHSWSEAEIAQFETAHPVGSKARLALVLGLYTVQRRGDVIRMGRQHISNGIIHVRQGKTGATLRIPLHPALQTVLDATPSEHLTLLVTKSGRPYSGNDLVSSSARGAMRRACLRGVPSTVFAKPAVLGSPRPDAARMRSRRSAGTPLCARSSDTRKRPSRNAWRATRWRGPRKQKTNEPVANFRRLPVFQGELFEFVR